MPNRLAKETSPYLLQHANNPVDWYPWGEEALQLAKEKDMPILVSIGYSACHWCHVMERESFEDEATAEIMNKHFVCIKIDREERPDLDHIYMAAVQTLTGQGGWPLNMFLSPDAKPFTGGTYFPPRGMYGRPSWTDVLLNIEELFRRDRAKIEDQAARLTSHVGTMSDAFKLESRQELPSAMEVFGKMERHLDRKNGGIGGAPKFPSVMTLQFLMRLGRLGKLGKISPEVAADALAHVQLSIQKMIRGGIYDQIGGGFARYATDEEWLVPHFEKMLYDNALLLTLLSEYTSLNPDQEMERSIRQTVDFVARELSAPFGAFYAALDADSEGVEGKYYIWKESEIDEVAGEDSDFFKKYMDVSEGGNWEGVNILNRSQSESEFAINHGLDHQSWAATVQRISSELMTLREDRIRPGLDDKVLLSWNALMAGALYKVGQQYKEPAWIKMADRCMFFIRHKMRVDLTLYHSWKDDHHTDTGFLEDYAYYIEALIAAYKAHQDFDLVEDACKLTEEVITKFSDTEEVLFHFTGKTQTDVVVRTTEVTDNATPSGNSVMLFNLLALGRLAGRTDFTARAERMLAYMQGALTKYPTSFGRWISVLAEKEAGLKELVVTGQHATAQAKRITGFAPEMLVLSAEQARSGAQFEGKEYADKALYYICDDMTCQAPTEVPEVAGLEFQSA